MIPTILLRDLGALAPMLIIFGSAMVILVADLFISDGKKYLNPMFALVALTSAVAVAWSMEAYKVVAFGGLFVMDDFTNFFCALFCLIGGAVVLLSATYLRLEGIEKGEFYALLLMSIVGMMVMAGARDLILLFLGLETMSIPIYVLAGFRKKRAESVESSLKYFLLGAFAAGFLLYGIALVYGATGSTRYDVIVANIDSTSLLLKGGIALIIVGLAFKVSAVPFHMWTPDVYEGAPTPVTAFMATAVKAAGFAALLRLFLTAFPAYDISSHWREVVWALAVVTMTLGNILALVQTNIKRMLAYSSIAHAGYILVGVVAASQEAAAGIMFYLVAYAVMNLGAFGCIALTAWKGHEGDTLEDFRGVGFEKPVMSAFLVIFLLSLTGMPPTAGFLGKFYVFGAAIKSHYYILAVIGVLNSVVAAYYYLRVIVVMYMTPAAGDVHPEDRSVFARGPLLAIALIATATITLALGLYPFLLNAVTTVSAQALFK